MHFFAKDGVTVGGIGTIQSDVYTGTGDTTIRFADGSDAILPSGANGGIRDGAVQLGHSSHRFKDLYLSGGAYIGGTGNANKLSSDIALTK